MVDFDVHGANRDGKHGVFHSGEGTDLCTRADDTMQRILLENSWVCTIKVCNALCMKIVLFHNIIVLAKHMREEKMQA